MKSRWFLSIGILTVLLAIGLLSGCPATGVDISGAGTRGDGNVVSQERNASNFSGVTLDGIGDVNIYCGENFKVVVTTDSNLQDILTTNVRGNILYIDQLKNTNIRNVTKMIIDVHMPELKSFKSDGGGNIEIRNNVAENVNVTLSGIGDIKIINGKTSNFEIIHSGGGNIDVNNYQAKNVNVTLSGIGDIKFGNGKTSDLRINHSGGGNIDAQNYEAENADVTLTGIGDIKIWATKSLKIKHSGGGDILYKGNPSISDISITGVGSIDRL